MCTLAREKTLKLKLKHEKWISQPPLPQQQQQPLISLSVHFEYNDFMNESFEYFHLAFQSNGSYLQFHMFHAIDDTF